MRTHPVVRNFSFSRTAMQVVAIVIAIALSVGLGTSSASASNHQSSVGSVSDKLAYSDDVRAKDLEAALTYIMDIPDEVLLAGESATANWVAVASNPSLRGNFWACSSAILFAIATTAIPVAKVLKIRKLVKSLGGVNKAVKVMWGASFSYEKVRALGGAAAALAGEIIGITAVRKGCF